MKKTSISLSMIVKDESKHLTSCLESIKDVVDEIIVIDTGSSDNTIEIAKKYGAIVKSFYWINDFSAARNFSLKQCSSEWILYLDADERLIKYDIQNIINDISEDIGLIRCLVEGWQLQPNGKRLFTSMLYPRIFRNIQGAKFTGLIHEQIHPSLISLGKKQIDSKIRISHLGYDCNKIDILDKSLRNYDLLIEQIQNNPIDSHAWYSLSQVLINLNRYDEAEKSILQSIDIDILTPDFKAVVFNTYAKLLLRKNEIKNALFWLKKSLRIEPKQVEGRLIKADCLVQSKRIPEAKMLYKSLLSQKKWNIEKPILHDIELNYKEVHEKLKALN